MRNTVFNLKDWTEMVFPDTSLPNSRYCINLNDILYINQYWGEIWINIMHPCNRLLQMINEKSALLVKESLFVLKRELETPTDIGIIYDSSLTNFFFLYRKFIYCWIMQIQVRNSICTQRTLLWGSFKNYVDKRR